MKRLGLFLLVVVLVAGCSSGSGPDQVANVQRGSEAQEQWWYDGRIHVWGNVVNVGDGDAQNTTLQFGFTSAGIEYFRPTLNLGVVRAGERVNYDTWFTGPAVRSVQTWTTYEILWDGKP